MHAADAGVRFIGFGGKFVYPVTGLEPGGARGGSRLGGVDRRRRAVVIKVFGYIRALLFRSMMLPHRCMVVSHGNILPTVTIPAGPGPTFRELGGGDGFPITIGMARSRRTVVGVRRPTTAKSLPVVRSRRLVVRNRWRDATERLLRISTRPPRTPARWTLPTHLPIRVRRVAQLIEPAWRSPRHAGSAGSGSTGSPRWYGTASSGVVVQRSGQVRRPDRTPKVQVPLFDTGAHLGTTARVGDEEAKPPGFGVGGRSSCRRCAPPAITRSTVPPGYRPRRPTAGPTGPSARVRRADDDPTPAHPAAGTDRRSGPARGTGFRRPRAGSTPFPSVVSAGGGWRPTTWGTAGRGAGALRS